MSPRTSAVFASAVRRVRLATSSESGRGFMTFFSVIVRTWGIHRFHQGPCHGGLMVTLSGQGEQREPVVRWSVKFDAPRNRRRAPGHGLLYDLIRPQKHRVLDREAKSVGG